MLLAILPACVILYVPAGKVAVLGRLTSEIATLTTSSKVELLDASAPTPSGCSVAIVDDATKIYMLLTGVLDPALEIQKLQKKVRGCRWYRAMGVAAEGLRQQC